MTTIFKNFKGNLDIVYDLEEFTSLFVFQIFELKNLNNPLSLKNTQ